MKNYEELVFNIIMILYFVFVVIYIGTILIAWQRIIYRKYVVTGFYNIILRAKKNNTISEESAKEMEKLYNTCCFKYKSLQKSYPTIISVFDDIHAIINTEYKSIILTKKKKEIINENYDEFLQIYNYFDEKYPFYELKQKQQDMLLQLKRGGCENESLLQDFRIEFRRINKEINKNDRNTWISYFIGISGVLISFVSYFKS